MGAEALPDDTLQKAEHVDLIQFGLIPEFVGRFPIMCSLQVTFVMPKLDAPPAARNVHDALRSVHLGLWLNAVAERCC
jgi:hypothetical protein